MGLGATAELGVKGRGRLRGRKEVGRCRVQGRPLSEGGVSAGQAIRGMWAPHQPAVSPAFQAQAQPAPCRPQDPGGTEGWAPSRPEDRIDKGDAPALGGVAGAGGRGGSPQGPLPAPAGWPPANPKQGLPGGREEGQVEEKGQGQGKGGRGRRKWRRGKGREKKEERGGGRKVKTPREGTGRAGEGEAGPGRAPAPP